MKIIILFFTLNLDLLSNPEPMLAPEKPKLKTFIGAGIVINHLNFKNHDNVWDGTYKSEENIFGANFKYKGNLPFMHLNLFGNMSLFQRNHKIIQTKLIVDPSTPPTDFSERTNEITTFALLDFGLGWEILKLNKFKLDLKGGFYYSFMLDRKFKSKGELFEFDNNDRSISDFGIVYGTNLTYNISYKYKIDFDYSYIFRLNGEKNNSPPFNFWRNGHSFKIGFLYAI